MSSDSIDSKGVLNANIRETFGRVVYTHKTHEKAREIESNRVTLIKWVNIMLTTLTSGSLLVMIITNIHNFLYVGSVLSALTLAFVIFQLSFNPSEAADKHRNAAKELWYMREQYANLLADLRCGLIETEVQRRRDELIEQLKNIYSHAPNTSSKAYIKAQKALKVKEDMTFSATEINQFLPEELQDKE